MRFDTQLRRLLFGASLFALSGAAFAWGASGHRLVAEAAERLLAPKARLEVERLLRTAEPGASLVSISTWADEVKSPSTASWHYVNMPRDANCTYDAKRDCPDGACVVGAIERQAAVLASHASDAERLKALRYLVHFVADVHQPLHAAFADDRGGNSFQVQAGGRGTNLHAVWDAWLIEAWPGGVAALRAELPLKVAGEASPEPSAWAEESCHLASAPGFYPIEHRLPLDYQERWSPTLAERLHSAGCRLATLLNQTLTKSASE